MVRAQRNCESWHLQAFCDFFWKSHEISVLSISIGPSSLVAKGPTRTYFLQSPPPPQFVDLMGRLHLDKVSQTLARLAQHSLSIKFFSHFQLKTLIWLEFSTKNGFMESSLFRNTESGLHLKGLNDWTLELRRFFFWEVLIIEPCPRVNSILACTFSASVGLSFAVFLWNRCLRFISSWTFCSCRLEKVDSVNALRLSPKWCITVGSDQCIL